MVNVKEKCIILRERLKELKEILNKCEICPRKCGANRSAGQKGICQVNNDIYVASFNIHTGEEPVISGTRGSGTVFFSGCTLKCVYCQNFPISQLMNGKLYTVEEAGEKLLELEKRGAHNINFVTPTHYIPQMVEMLLYAYERGLTIPVVYNTSGYENVEILKKLEGIIEIYLPDMRYNDNANALKYSGVNNYVEINRNAIIEMYRQVGILKTDENGIAEKGLIIRHLVLPNNISGSKGIFEFISNLDKRISISLLRQYFPAYKAHDIEELSRKITNSEYEEAIEYLEYYDLNEGWIQNDE